MRSYKMVDLIIFLEGEVLHGDWRIEDVIILQEKQHGLKEDMFDMLCTESALILLLADTEQEELVLE